MQTTSSTSEPTLIIAGRLHRTDGTWGPGEVWIMGSTIVAVHDGPPPFTPVTQSQRIDVGNDFVLPGAIDAHVHSLSHPGEGIRAATRSAAAGGVTTIVEMPFDQAGAINSRDRLLDKQELVNREAFIDVALLGTLAPAGGWKQAETLVENGVVGFKVSLFMGDEARFPRIDDYELRHVMRAVKDTASTLCTHAENNEIVKSLLATEEVRNPTDAGAHSRSRPPVSETLGVLTALEIAAESGAALHICHLSLPRSVDLVAWYQSEGVDVTLETCPHYLTFTEDDLSVQRGRLKINPPIRTAADREGLWRRLESGAITVVSSDHAPWPSELKDHKQILDNHSGVPGVETLVAVTLGAAIRRDSTYASLSAAIDALTIAPAKRYGIDHLKGSLEVGKDADIMVFSPNANVTIDGSALHSNAGWSPYDGMTPGGAITHTVSRGDLVWTRGSGLVGSDGRGIIVTRTS